MKIDGQCHCGAIAWAADIDPARIVVCHCTDCQIMGGGAFLWGAAVPIDQLAILRGAPATYRKRGSSGAWRRLHFCAVCSTPLYGTEDAAPETASLRLGSCNQARELRPALQLWHRSALDWLDGLGTLPAIETQPGGLYRDV